MHKYVNARQATLHPFRPNSMRLFKRSCKQIIITFGLGVTSTTVLAEAQTTPTVGGFSVLTRMHDAYAGQWYKTLTFTQKTTVYRPGAAPRVQTWVESMRSTADKGTQLRIDMGDLSAGQGVLYTADSSWSVVAGKVCAPRPEGNEFIPLIQSVYVQPVAQTDAELTRLGFNMARAHLTELACDNSRDEFARPAGANRRVQQLED
ncbi:MAG: hypothetical protein ABI120_08890 [Gemmatimonadaceae bacterium]